MVGFRKDGFGHVLKRELVKFFGRKERPRERESSKREESGFAFEILIKTFLISVSKNNTKNQYFSEFGFVISIP